MIHRLSISYTNMINQLYTWYKKSKCKNGILDILFWFLPFNHRMIVILLKDHWSFTSKSDVSIVKQWNIDWSYWFINWVVFNGMKLFSLGFMMEQGLCCKRVMWIRVVTSQELCEKWRWFQMNYSLKFCVVWSIAKI